MNVMRENAQPLLLTATSSTPLRSRAAQQRRKQTDIQSQEAAPQQVPATNHGITGDTALLSQ
jgi:hypothetical protein